MLFKSNYNRIILNKILNEIREKLEKNSMEMKIIRKKNRLSFDESEYKYKIIR